MDNTITTNERTSPHEAIYYQKGNVKVNLTKMFGKGNEPTPEEFEAMFPPSYYTYKKKS